MSIIHNSDEPLTMQKTILSLLLVVFAIANATAQYEQSFITLGDTIHVTGYEPESSAPKSKRMKQFLLDITGGYTYRAPRYGFVNGVNNDILYLKGIQSGFNAGGSFSYRFHRNMAAGLLYSFNQFNNTDRNGTPLFTDSPSPIENSIDDHISIQFAGAVFKVLFPLKDNRFCLGYSLGAGPVIMTRKRLETITHQSQLKSARPIEDLKYYAIDYAYYFDINATYQLVKHVSLLLQASCIMGTFDKIIDMYDQSRVHNSYSSPYEYTEGCSLIQVSMGVRCNF